MAFTQITPASRRHLLNKVPEVTLWFWVIKILCTTVGESFADYISVTRGVGLIPTSVIFTVAFVVVLAAQMLLRRYVPGVYWLTVVVVSVTGTLYTDILTDRAGVPLWVSSAVFSLLLAGIFGVWYARERTLSIHSIVTTPREAFYWLAVLVTFALGTATGDWTLELTGWGPGKSVLLPLGLIAIITALWRFGANPVLAFWLAYILTRPLGANIGDWLATPSSEQGLGLGTFGTSIVFLSAILATVVYLSVSRTDVISESDPASTDRTDDGGAASAPATAHAAGPRDLMRERVSLAVLAAVAVATAGLLTFTNSQPHADLLAEGEGGGAPSCSGGSGGSGGSGSLDDTEARQRVADAFPAGDTEEFRTIVADTLSITRSGDAAGAAVRITDLETAWDDAETRLVDQDCLAWTYVDQEIDAALNDVRDAPDGQGAEDSLGALAATLGEV